MTSTDTHNEDEHQINGQKLENLVGFCSFRRPCKTTVGLKNTPWRVSLENLRRRPFALTLPELEYLRRRTPNDVFNSRGTNLRASGHERGILLSQYSYLPNTLRFWIDMRMFVFPVVTTGLLEFHSTTGSGVRLRSCDGCWLNGENRQTN